MRTDLTEEDAKIIFARQLRALAAEGAAPDCEQQMAKIIAENETECARMEREFAAQDAEGLSRGAATGG